MTPLNLEYGSLNAQTRAEAKHSKRRKVIAMVKLIFITNMQSIVTTQQEISCCVAVPGSYVLVTSARYHVFTSPCPH
jgi:hypothetical protein